MFANLPGMLNPQLISAAMKELLETIGSSSLTVTVFKANEKWIFSGENFWSYFGMVDYFEMFQPRNSCSPAYISTLFRELLGPSPSVIFGQNIQSIEKYTN